MFPFNQPDKTKDCGYRCAYYAIGTEEPYESWLDQFKMFDPQHHGILFTDIAQLLKFNKLEYKFTQLSEEGLYIVYSGSWLKHGHYFVYHNGVVYCSTKSEPYRMPLQDVVDQLETKSSDHGFKIMKVFPFGLTCNIKQKPWEKEEAVASK